MRSPPGGLDVGSHRCAFGVPSFLPHLSGCAYFESNGNGSVDRTALFAVRLGHSAAEYVCVCVYDRAYAID